MIHPDIFIRLRRGIAWERSLVFAIKLPTPSPLNLLAAHCAACGGAYARTRCIQAVTTTRVSIRTSNTRGGEKLFGAYRYRFILLLDVTLGFVRFRAPFLFPSPTLMLFLHFYRSRIGFSYENNQLFVIMDNSIEIDCEIGERCFTSIFAIDNDRCVKLALGDVNL